MRKIESQFRKAVASRSTDIKLVTSPTGDGFLAVLGSHPDFGLLDIELHDREVTIYLGKHTHCHFTEYSDSPPGHHVEAAAEFLDELISDRVVVWSFGACGGCYQSEEAPLLNIPSEASRYLWSGPVQ